MSRKSEDRALVVVGIDPGINGAVAFLRYGRGSVFQEVASMPTEFKRSGKRQVDAKQLRGLIEHSINVQEEDDKNGVKFIIEQVSAMPGQGVSGMFSLGDSYGVARGVAEQFGAVAFVVPQKWKSAMGITLSKEDRERLGKNKAAQASKAAALTLARRLFPAARPSLFRKKDEGRAEAILLAYYARKHLGW